MPSTDSQGQTADRVVWPTHLEAMIAIDWLNTLDICAAGASRPV